MGWYRIRACGRFQSIADLLAKQRWHILKNLESLFSHIFKSKYCPSTDFIEASLLYLAWFDGGRSIC